MRIIKTSQSAREIYRANALNLRSKGLTLAEVADFLEISVRTVCNIEDNYEAGGLDKALHDDPRPGAPVQFDHRVKSHVVATVCTTPPEGFDRWTLELIREQIVKRDGESERGSDLTIDTRFLLTGCRIQSRDGTGRLTEYRQRPYRVSSEHRLKRDRFLQDGLGNVGPFRVALDRYDRVLFSDAAAESVDS